MQNFLENQLPAIITGLLGLGAWIWERRSKNAELQKIEADAMISMQAAYKTYVADSNERYAELKKDQERMQTQLLNIQGEVIRLQKEVVIWKDKYENLRREMNLMENGVNKTSSGKL